MFLQLKGLTSVPGGGEDVCACAEALGFVARPMRACLLQRQAKQARISLCKQ